MVIDLGLPGAPIVRLAFESCYFSIFLAALPACFYFLGSYNYSELTNTFGSGISFLIY